MDILNILLGGSIIAFIQFLIVRHDDRREKKDELIKKIDEIKKDMTALHDEVQCVKEDNERERTVNKRVRILRFEDELQENKRHSKDSFDQVLSDITDYNHYCEDHPEFKNDQTAATVAHIKAIYQERLDKRDFA